MWMLQSFLEVGNKILMGGNMETNFKAENKGKDNLSFINIMSNKKMKRKIVLSDSLNLLYSIIFILFSIIVYRCNIFNGYLIFYSRDWKLTKTLCTGREFIYYIETQLATFLMLI